jgi:hypothetical protein
MKKIACLFILGLWVAILLLACAPPGGSPTDVFGTLTALPQASGSPSATLQTSETPSVTVEISASPSVTATAAPSATPTLGTPVSATPPVLETLCQFCLDTIPHAIVAIDQAASFEVILPISTTPTATPAPENQIVCATVETLNGKQLVLCHGPQGAVVTLNVCLPGGSANCTKFPITLITCPLVAVTATPTLGSGPGNTATNTPAAAPTDTPTTAPTTTPTP